jgi:hypothetical protein
LLPFRIAIDNFKITGKYLKTTKTMFQCDFKFQIETGKMNNFCVVVFIVLFINGMENLRQQLK